MVFSQSNFDLDSKLPFWGGFFIVLIAFATRFFQLDSQLWLDEYSAIIQNFRRSTYDLIFTYPGSASHLLYELLGHWSSTLFGESSFSIRLPAALFGVAGVGMAGLIAARIVNSMTGLLVAGLMAVSYHHIFFSQNARGYTLLIFLFLWLTYLFMRLAHTRVLDIKQGGLYAFVTVLTCYSQPFGVFVPAGHFIVACGLALMGHRNQDDVKFPFKAYFIWMSVAAIFTILLYAPLVAGMLEHAAMNASTSEEGPRFGIDLLIEVIEGLRAAFFGYVGLAIATIAGSAGALIWIKRDAMSFFVVMAPFVLQALVFTGLGFGIHPRYFAIAIPIIYLAGGMVIYLVFDWVFSRFFEKGAVRTAMNGSLIVFLMLLTSVPLIRYYQVPKQDFQGAMHFVEDSIDEHGLRIGVQSVGSIMSTYYNLDYTRIDSYEELLTAEQKGQRVWVVMTLERIMSVADPKLVDHIHNQYTLLKQFPGTVGDGSIQVYRQNTITAQTLE